MAAAEAVVAAVTAEAAREVFKKARRFMIDGRKVELWSASGKADVRRHFDSTHFTSLAKVGA